jgi:PhzF family phenazine biosynthesis protein
MSRPIFVVDAFTGTPYRGNPAAVVLGHGDETWMQAVATEMRHSETAFVRSRPDGAFDLRWFTPEVEVDLCGHATLASAHVLHETAHLGEVTFHTRSGPLGARVEAGGAVTLDFPAARPVPAPADPALFAALGVEPAELLRTDGDFFLCVVDDARTVRDLAPDFGALRALRTVRGVYVTAPGDGDFDIVSRCFAPRVGIDEDPVTGSMHCVLVSYWAPRLGKPVLRAFQASARGGELVVRAEGDRALLTGRAVTVLRGDLDA